MKSEQLTTSDKHGDASSKGHFFWRNSPVVEYPPKSVFIDYKEGKERTVRDALKNDMYEMAKNLGWGKSGVTYNLIKVEGHPKLEDGYAYEIQLNGDGGSYLEEVLSALKSADVHQVWIECSKQYAFIECKLGQLETSISHIKASSGDSLISVHGKPRKMKPLYVENYAFFYVSAMLFIASAFSIPAAAMFKYVWFNQEKHITDVNHYTPEKYVPVEVLKAERSTDAFRIAAVRYLPSKGWFIIKDEEVDGVLVQYEQNIDENGRLSDRVKTGEKALPAEMLIGSETEISLPSNDE